MGAQVEFTRSSHSEVVSNEPLCINYSNLRFGCASLSIIQSNSIEKGFTTQNMITTVARSVSSVTLQMTRFPGKDAIFWIKRFLVFSLQTAIVGLYYH